MSIVERVKRIMLSPREEWPVIDAEPATVGSIYSGYVIPLSALPAIATFIGLSVIGVGAFGFHYRVPIGTGLGGMVTRFVLGLVGVYVVALVIDALAPTFGGTKNPIAALKVSAYSYTAAWVGGILMIIPALGIITLLVSLYCFYLLYTGLPVLMKSPADKAVGYTAVVVIVTIVIYIVIGYIVTALFGFNPAMRPGM
jgi:hypothetical protein